MGAKQAEAFCSGGVDTYLSGEHSFHSTKAAINDNCKSEEYRLCCRLLWAHTGEWVKYAYWDTSLLIASQGHILKYFYCCHDESQCPFIFSGWRIVLWFIEISSHAFAFTERVQVYLLLYKMKLITSCL